MALSSGKVSSEKASPGKSALETSEGAPPFPVIVRLNHESLDDIESIEIESNQIPWNRKLLQGEFANPHSRYYGVRFGGRLVGFLLLQCCLDEAHILAFGVRRESRQRGAGRALLTEVMTQIHEEGIQQVYLEVRRGNGIARRLYETVGFVEVNQRPRYYYDNGEDAILMNLSLSAFIASKREI